MKQPCIASGRRANSFGGGKDQCPVCGRLVYIAARDGRVAKHYVTVPATQTDEDRERERRFAEWRLFR